VAASKKIVVLDASVIIKWFVEEEYTKEALTIRKDYVDGKVDIACPSLLPYEILNALRYNPELGEEHLNNAAVALEKYHLWQYPILGELANLCIRNSLAYGISLYDSSYVSLAEYLDSNLYTADEKLLDKVGRDGRFLHISEY
jgi:predicted nucleic acid-binding protein